MLWLAYIAGRQFQSEESFKSFRAYIIHGSSTRLFAQISFWNFLQPRDEGEFTWNVMLRKRQGRHGFHVLHHLDGILAYAFTDPRNVLAQFHLSNVLLRITIISDGSSTISEPVPPRSFLPSTESFLTRVLSCDVTCQLSIKKSVAKADLELESFTNHANLPSHCEAAKQIENVH